MTTLCLDFGNTLKKAAIFKNGQIEEIEVLSENIVGSVNDILNKYQPQRSILSSVIEDNAELNDLLLANTLFFNLSYQIKLPFTAPVSKPETIGADRLALAAAAVSTFPGSHKLVIALGSCITFNFINKYNQFLGGSISPGLDMRLKALNTFTAKLPLIKKDWNFPLVGYDTKTNILSGVILGMAAEIDGMIDQYANKYSNFNVLLTGGDGAYFARHLKNKIFADPQLIFKGLYTIIDYNDDSKT